MVSDQKKARVIDSIKKLVALGVSEKEIIGNLTDVGINITEAKKLLDEAKNKPIPISQMNKEFPEKNLYDEKTQDLSIDDQISGQLNIKSSLNKSAFKTNSKVQQTQQKNNLPQNSGHISQNADLGLKIKESTIKVLTDSKNINEKRSDENEMAESMITNENKQIAKKKFGLFGRKSNNDPIEELQKSLNLTSNQMDEKTISKEINPKKENYQAAPYSQISKTEQKSVEEKVAEKVAPGISNDELEQLWKKGIVTAINSKLSEMKKLKEDIDIEINTKVDVGIKKELQQFKVLLESQKALIISTNKEALEDKQKEITLVIDSKISELKKQSADLSQGITKVEAAKKEQEASLQQIQNILADAKKTKSQLMIEMNSELIKAKSSAQAFIDSSEKHLEELDERVNKTLELEKNVADGLVAEAEQKIEKMTITKADDLIEKLEVKLNNLEAMQLKINPEKIDEKIALLDEFKKQFLQNIQENLSQINGAIKELNEKNEEADKILQSKTLAIDAKIEELTKFEKSFTTKLDSLLKK